MSKGSGNTRSGGNNGSNFAAKLGTTYDWNDTNSINIARQNEDRMKQALVEYDSNHSGVRLLSSRSTLLNTTESDGVSFSSIQVVNEMGRLGYRVDVTVTPTDNFLINSRMSRAASVSTEMFDSLKDAIAAEAETRSKVGEIYRTLKK